MSTHCIVSTDENFIQTVETTLSEILDNPTISKFNNCDDFYKDLSDNEYGHIIVDHDSCFVPLSLLSLLEEVSEKNDEFKSVILAKEYSTVPPMFRCQDKVHVVSKMANKGDLATIVKEVIEGKSYLWGQNIAEVFLSAGETLCKEGSEETAVYLVNQGVLKREKSDGTVIDEEITTGDVVGELSYFRRGPKVWSVTAQEDCKLVRISFMLIEKKLNQLPSWIIAIFNSLAKRAFKYSQKK